MRTRPCRVRVHPVASWVKVSSRKDILRAKYGQQFVPSNYRVFLDLSDNIVVVAFVRFVVPQEPQTGDTLQFGTVLVIVAVVGVDKVIETVQRSKSHRSSRLAQLGINSNAFHEVVITETEIAGQPE